jgi:hypothetical protein
MPGLGDWLSELMTPEQWAAISGPGVQWQGGENIVTGLAKIAMAPGQALQSTTPITTEEMIKPAGDIALATMFPAAGTGPEAGTVLTAGMRRARRGAYAQERPLEDFVPPPMGHNMPPEPMQLEPAPPAPAAAAPAAAPPVASPVASELAQTAELPPAPQPQTWAQGLPRPKPAAQSTAIPDIRGLPVDQAIEIARTQPHLIKSGERGEGLYVGGPRELQSKQALNATRRAFDKYLGADPRGGDWYDRYRTGMNEVTGGDPLQNQWMSAQEGQWSAGVDPGSELHFALKENNASLAGMPVKAARPAQHEAHLAAIEAKDPSLYRLGDKTEEYATKVNPDQLNPPGATGVNDFRHARNFNYTEPSGAPQKGALGDAGHRFLDMETALAVDRANRANLGGRSDWTGEQLQAAPWVRQKALDIMSRNKNLTYEEAYDRANRTIADYFDRHTAFATHEDQPGANVLGHMLGSVAAPAAERTAFAADQRSGWATAPGQRDAIYSGMGIPGTGVNMRVRPTLPMQGFYQRPDGTIESNPGNVARPLVTFNTGKDPFKVTTPQDQALLNAGEAVRAYVDAQNAGAWHKTWAGGPQNQSTSLRFPREGPATTGEMLALRQAGEPHGLTDIVDTGKGITASSFPNQPAPSREFDRALRKGAFGQFGEPSRVRVGPGDAGYIDYVDKWQEGVGSGAATRQLLDYVSKTPEIRTALNSNPYLGERALARVSRDEDWATKWGAPREDIQNARRIIGDGPGWVDRIEAALKKGAILPATAAAIFGADALVRRQGGSDAGS